MKPAVFLDRDGTLIEDVNYISKVEDIRVIPGTCSAVKKLNDNGILAVLISNQSGAARGYFEESAIQDINNALQDHLKAEGAALDGFYYCPHHPKGSVASLAVECDCRKPKAGLINNALKDFGNIDIKRSYVIGDKASDVEVARNAGCKGILVATGYGREVLAGNYQEFVEPDFVAENIEEAVDWLLNDLKK